MKNATAKAAIGMSMLAVVWALGAGCGKPYTTSPTAAKTTATPTPTITLTDTGTPVPTETNTDTHTPIVILTPVPTITNTYTVTCGAPTSTHTPDPPLSTPTPTNTGCAKFCVQLTPLVGNPAPAGYLATGYAFNLNDAIGGGTCPSKVLSYFSFAVTTAGNLSTEILGIEFWRNGAKVADVPWTGSAFTVSVAPAMTYYGEVRYVLSANAAGAVTTTITGAGGYYNGYPGDPQAFWISGNCGTYTTPSQGLWVLPPPPTATATVHAPGSCPASVTCGTNGSGLVEAVGYGAGTAGSESVTCTSMNGATGAIYTETVDAASDSSDIYTVFLPYMGNPVCVILDSFDNGTGANQFTLSATHCLGVGRTGTVNTLCGGGVVMMQTTAQAYDTNVTIEVTATQGAGPYRLIVLNQ